jgi:isopropylmalate/citramalate/homocitrate synthase-like protein
LAKPKIVKIFDTTLRDGEQTPGVALTPNDKLQIARQLDRLNVDVIEAGFPSVSTGEKEAVRLIAKDKLNAEVCALARTLREDLDAALACDVDSIHTFIATSDIHIKHKLRLTCGEVLKRAIEAVEYVKEHGLTVEFSAEDATRTDVKFLKRVFKAVVEAGADRINIPDTVGIMTPKRMSRLVGEIAKVVKVPISVHCHNDLGMATANSLAGVEAGASQVHVTVNGLGERAGNAPLEEVAVALHSIYKEFKTRINMKLIYETSRLVSQLTGVQVQPNKAIVGENAFTHESGVHAHGVIRMPLTYEPISPELVGRKTMIVAGKHAGIHGVKEKILELGFNPTNEQMKEIIRQIKEFGDRGKQVTTTDLISIVSIVCGQVPSEEKTVELKELAVVTGSNVIPTASVKLTIDGKDYVSSETGVGPVDAAIKAIRKLTDNLVNIRLKEYRLDALTGGSDAMAEVVVKVEDPEGRIVSARAANADIVRASVEAMINGINRLLFVKKREKTS